MDVMESYKEDEVNDVSVADRVMSMRGKFFDLSMDRSKLQVYLQSTLKEVVEVHKDLRRGDIVGVSDHLAFSKTKVLTLYASELVSLSGLKR
ncbi:lysine--tRNA ligase [Ranunculus cassubicifolius]